MYRSGCLSTEEYFLNLDKSTVNKLYLSFSDWLRTKLNTVYFQMNLKMVNTFWFRFDLMRIKTFLIKLDFLNLFGSEKLKSFLCVCVTDTFWRPLSFYWNLKATHLAPLETILRKLFVEASYIYIYRYICMLKASSW